MQNPRVLLNEEQIICRNSRNLAFNSELQTRVKCVLFIHVRSKEGADITSCISGETRVCQKMQCSSSSTEVHTDSSDTSAKSRGSIKTRLHGKHCSGHNHLNSERFSFSIPTSYSELGAVQKDRPMRFDQKDCNKKYFSLEME